MKPLVSDRTKPPRRLLHKMNDVTLAFWHFFAIAYAFTHFNARLFGTFPKKPLRSKAVNQCQRKQSTALATCIKCLVFPNIKPGPASPGLLKRQSYGTKRPARRRDSTLTRITSERAGRIGRGRSSGARQTFDGPFSVVVARSCDIKASFSSARRDLQDTLGIW